MKIAITAFILMTLVGCGKWERAITHFTGDLTYKCSKNGIEYVQSDSGIALHVDTNGAPVRCSK